MKKLNREVYPSLQAQYEEIMNNFDFEHVCELMHWDKATKQYNDDGRVIYSKWSWAGIGVPNIDQIKEFASKLMQSAIAKIKGDSYHTSCGGFDVEICNRSFGFPGILSLKFAIEEWSGVY